MQANFMKISAIKEKKKNNRNRSLVRDDFFFFFSRDLTEVEKKSIWFFNLLADL